MNQKIIYFFAVLFLPICSMEQISKKEEFPHDSFKDSLRSHYLLSGTIGFYHRMQGEYGQQPTTYTEDAESKASGETTGFTYNECNSYKFAVERLQNIESNLSDIVIYGQRSKDFINELIESFFKDVTFTEKQLTDTDIIDFIMSGPLKNDHRGTYGFFDKKRLLTCCEALELLQSLKTDYSNHSFVRLFSRKPSQHEERVAQLINMLTAAINSVKKECSFPS